MDQKEFTSIAADIRKKALSICRRYGIPDDDSDDIAQDTLLKLWALRHSLEQLRSVEAYATTITRHLCMDFVKQRRHIPIDGMAITDDNGAAPDTQLEVDDNEEWLRRQLEKLPTKEHQVLHLRHVEQKTNKEIAEILGMETTSVATILSRARHKMMERLNRRNARENTVNTSPHNTNTPKERRTRL